MRTIYLLSLALFFFGCDTTEESTLELFAPEGQFVEVVLSDGQTYRLEAVPLAQNTTQFFYDADLFIANGFINRKSLGGDIGGFLNFNPRLPDNVFDEVGTFVPDSLAFPYVIPASNFQLNIDGLDGETTEYFFENVDVTLESWEGDIVTGYFQQDRGLGTIEPLIINRSTFQVYLQAIKL